MSPHPSFIYTRRSHLIWEVAENTSLSVTHNGEVGLRVIFLGKYE